MTHPVDSDAEPGTEDLARSLSRREMRKEWLAQQSIDGLAEPKSIFDLPFVLRKRVLPTPEPSEPLDEELDRSPEEDAESESVPAPLPAATAAAMISTTLPSVLPTSDEKPAANQSEDTSAPIASKKLPVKKLPVKKLPAKKLLPPARPELQPQPQPDSLNLTVHPKAPESIEGTLLFDRIPEPAGPVASAPQETSQNEAASQPTVTQFSPRRKLAGSLAVVAAFGMMLTMALPAIAPTSEDSAVAAGGQVLFSGGGTEARIDFESFESVDELEAAADAATLEAGSFTNNPSAEVQYPFSKGVPLTDGFGPRAFPVSGFHDAQDFAAGYGAAVRSIAAGTVIESGPASDGCGFGLKIEHLIDGQTVHSRYCHLATNPLVGVGEQVRVSQFVGLVGNSGLSFGPHLHLVIEVDGTAVDPMTFIAKYNQPRSSAVSASST